jgi:hypothetical protein
MSPGTVADGSAHPDVGEDTRVDAMLPDAGLPAAARLTAEGALLVEGRHSVAPDGKGNYALAWIEIPAGEAKQRVVFAVVSPQGKVLAGPDEIVPLDKGQTFIRLFHTGAGFVLFRNDDGSSHVTAVSFSAPAAGAILAKSTDVGGYYQPALYPTDTGFVVLSASQATCASGQTAPANQVRARPLDPEGVPTTGSVLVECTGERQLYPQGVWTGSRHFVIWTDYRSATRVRGVSLDKDLKPVAPSEVLWEQGGTQSVAGLAHDGEGNLLASWTKSGHLWHLALSEDGTPLWSEAVQLIPDNRLESLTNEMTGGGGRVAVVWESDAQTVLTQIRLLLIDPGAAAPQALAPVLLTHLDYGFLYPHAARGSSGYGVSFLGEVAGNRALYFEAISD